MPGHDPSLSAYNDLDTKALVDRLNANRFSKNSGGQENKRSPALADLDLMPFGKHKGERMQDVPPTYLSWLWHDGKKHERDKVANYIWNSRNGINLELKGTDADPIN